MSLEPISIYKKHVYFELEQVHIILLQNLIKKNY